MSVQKVQQRFTVPSLTSRKAAGGDPIVCLTSYHAHTARLIDPYVDVLLVGDSLGMVMYGMESTLGVTLDMMIAHGAAVVRGSERALVVVDMPFGTYEESPEVAFRNAARIIKETGCQAVKLEGGQSMAATIAYMHERGIPVMAHIGLILAVYITFKFFHKANKEKRSVFETGNYNPAKIFVIFFLVFFIFIFTKGVEVLTKTNSYSIPYDAPKKNTLERIQEFLPDAKISSYFEP